MASTTTVTTEVNGRSKKRITRPNKQTFQENLAKLDVELKAKESDLEQARVQVKKAQNATSPEGDTREKLLGELDKIKQKQAQIKSSRGKILDELRSVEDGLKKKVKELQATKSKSNFKTVEEVDAQISKLEKQVDSGTLRLVDEKRYLGDISNLKKCRKAFSSLDSTQASIDADREKVKQLKSVLDDSESKAVRAEYTAITEKLDALRESQQKAHKSKSSLFDKRKQAQAARDEVRKAINDTKQKYYQQLQEFITQQKSDEAARQEKEKAEKAAAEKQRRKEEADAKLEAAKEPAYSAQIDTAENLLLFFDPDYKKPESDPLRTSLAPKSASGRTIDGIPEGATILKKEEEFFFAGVPSSKKTRKRSKDDDKLRLNITVIEDLSTLGISVPASKDDVANTISKIKEKIQYYKENQDRVTAERVEKAKDEIAKIEAQLKEEEAHDSNNVSNIEQSSVQDNNDESKGTDKDHSDANTEGPKVEETVA